MSGFNMPPGVATWEIPGNEPDYWQRHRKKIGDIHRESLARLMRMRPPNAIYSTDRIEFRRDDLKGYIGIAEAWITEFSAILDHIAEETRDHFGARVESPEIVEGAYLDFISAIRAAADQGD